MSICIAHVNKQLLVLLVCFFVKLCRVAGQEDFLPYLYHYYFLVTDIALCSPSLDLFIFICLFVCFELVKKYPNWLPMRTFFISLGCRSSSFRSVVSVASWHMQLQNPVPPMDADVQGPNHMPCCHADLQNSQH